MKSFQLIGLYVVLLLLAMFPPATGLASASQARITHLVIKNTAASLQVDLKIDSDFTPEMKAAVLKGVPIHFTISIRLYEVNDFWFDDQVADITAMQELRYDALKKVYQIIRSRGLQPPTAVDDLDSARLLISEINDLAVIPLMELKKGEHYQLMVGTVLGIKKHPSFNLFQGLKTDRYTVNFIH